MNFTLTKCYQILVPSASAQDSFQGGFAVLVRDHGQGRGATSVLGLPGQPGSTLPV